MVADQKPNRHLSTLLVLINVRYLVIINGGKIGHEEIHPSEDIAQN
jgi:hypothetical protein